MRDAGLDIYGSALIAKEEDIKRRPEMIRAYVEETMEGRKDTRDHQEEALKILLKLKPELDGELTRIQIKNGVEEVFIPAESVASGYGHMKPDVMEKTVKITNEFFEVAGKVPLLVSMNQFIRKKISTPCKSNTPPPQLSTPPMIMSRASRVKAPMGRRRRRAGISQHAYFLIRTDDFFRRRQLDPAVAAAGADHRIRFRHIIQQRRIDAVLAAVFVGDQGSLDAEPLARPDRQHHLDKCVARAEPGEQRGVGAELRGKLRRVVGNDFFGVIGVVGNPLQYHAGEIDLSRRLLAV